MAKINATTLEVVDELSGMGANLEGVTFCEDMICVSNRGTANVT